MKIIYTFSLLYILFINTSSWATENTVLTQQAKTTVTNYLNALSLGDTLAIKGLLGGDLLRKRENLLDNPSYSDMLRNIYSDVEYEILDTYVKGGNIVVDVNIILNFQESMKTRFMLNSLSGQPNEATPLKIIVETDLLDQK